MTVKKRAKRTAERLVAVTPAQNVPQPDDLVRYYDDGWHYGRAVEVGRIWIRIKHPVPTKVKRDDGTVTLKDHIVRRKLVDVQKVFMECSVHHVLYSSLSAGCEKCMPHFKRRVQR